MTNTTNITLIEELLTQLNDLPHRNKEALDALYRRSVMIIRNIFGKDSPYLTDLSDINFYPQVIPADEITKDMRWKNGAAELKNLYLTMKDELTLFYPQDHSDPATSPSLATDKEYDVAFSFAGEHRQYVEQTKVACEKLGLRVFYDRDKNNEWWGKNFISEQRKTYGKLTRYFVPFISPEYFSKPIPSDEFESAMMTAVERGDDYILPVIIGNPDVPTEKLHPHTHYLRAERYTPDQIAAELLKRVRSASDNRQPAKDIAEVVDTAIKVRMPKAIPRNFSKYREAEATIKYLGDTFADAVRQLESETDFTGIVRRRDDSFTVRVEHNGKTVYTLNVFQGGMGDDEAIGFNLDRDISQRSSYHAIARPYYSKEVGAPKLDVNNFSLLGMGNPPQIEHMTKEELFESIWERMLEQIEARAT